MKALLKIFLLAMLCHTANGQSITDGLILHYPLNGTAIDESTNQLDGDIDGATSTEGRFGNASGAFFFDGVDDEITLPNDPLLKPEFPVSISFWIKVESLEQLDNRILATEHSYNNFCGIWITTSAANTGKVSLNFGDNSNGAGPNNRRSKVSDDELQIGSWHHVVCIIRDGLDMSIYIDCQDAGGSYSGSGDMNVGYSNQSGSIGSIPPNSNFSTTYNWGTLDDVAMWDRELTELEIDLLCMGEPLFVQEKTAEEKGTLTIQPNPASDKCILTWDFQPNNTLRYDIMQFDGRIIQRWKSANKTETIATSTFKPGIYFVRVMATNGYLLTTQRLSVVQ